jgi:hypothetical protein
MVCRSGEECYGRIVGLFVAWRWLTAFQSSAEELETMMERCLCGNLLRSQTEQERKRCLECQMATSLQEMVASASPTKEPRESDGALSQVPIAAITEAAF